MDRRSGGLRDDGCGDALGHLRRHKKSRPVWAAFRLWRWARDSNPGNLSVQRFSRPPLSTTQPAHLNCLPGRLPAGSAHYIAALYPIKFLRCRSGCAGPSRVIARTRYILLHDRHWRCFRRSKEFTQLGTDCGFRDRLRRNPRIVHGTACFGHAGCRVNILLGCFLCHRILRLDSGRRLVCRSRFSRSRLGLLLHRRLVGF